MEAFLGMVARLAEEAAETAVQGCVHNECRVRSFLYLLFSLYTGFQGLKQNQTCFEEWLLWKASRIIIIIAYWYASGC